MVQLRKALLNATQVIVEGYELDEYSLQASLMRVGFAEDEYWEFPDQEISINPLDGAATATTATGKTVTLSFHKIVPMTDEDFE